MRVSNSEQPHSSTSERQLASVGGSKGGIVYVLLASSLFALTGIFTKLISADSWTILSWRGHWGAAIIFSYIQLKPEFRNTIVASLRSWQIWVLALVGFLSSITFITAFKFTAVTNVAVIYALLPFAAAFLERTFIGQRASVATLVASAATVMGVLLIISQSLAPSHLFGNALALLMTILNAVYALLVRMFNAKNVMLSGALASLLVALFGWLFTEPLAVGMQDFSCLLLFGAAFGGAAILWTEGARQITAAEVGLLSSADIPVAMLFAYLFLSEIPSSLTLLGAGVVLATVLLYTKMQFRLR